MKFGVVVEIDCPAGHDIGEWLPDFDMEQTEGDSEATFSYLGDEWEDSQHRKLCGVLSADQVQSYLVERLGLIPTTTETMGTLGGPWAPCSVSPAIDFSQEYGAVAIIDAYVTPLPDSREETIVVSTAGWDAVKNAVLRKWGNDPVWECSCGNRMGRVPVVECADLGVEIVLSCPECAPSAGRLVCLVDEMKNIPMLDFHVGAELGEYEQGPTMLISDPCYGEDVWCIAVLEVKAGTYIGAVSYDKSTRVSALCAVRKGEKVVRWQPTATVGVDSGQMAITDSMYRYGGLSEDAYYRKVCEATLGSMGAAITERGVCSSSGYGDGVYTVFEALNADSEVVGAAVRFIETQ